MAQKANSPLNLSFLGNSWPNPFASVYAFAAHYEIPVPKGDWRLTEYELGEINGLPASRGRVVATNGIMCYIIREDKSLYYGHFTAWQPDVDDLDQPDKNKPAGKSKKATAKINLAFVNF